MRQHPYPVPNLAALGPAVLSSDGEGKFGECLRDPMPWIDVGAKFVVAAAEVLDEGVSSAYRLAGAQPFETPHGSQCGFQAAVICFDGVVRVLLGDVTGGRQQLVEHARVGGRPVGGGLYLGAWVKNRRVTARSRFSDTRTSMT